MSNMPDDQKTLDLTLRRFFLLLLPLGAVASCLAILLSPKLEAIDWVFLPSLALILSSLTLWLWHDVRAMQVVKSFVFAIFIVYQIAGLLDYALRGLLYTQGFSITAIWFSLVYPLAFLVFPLRWAGRLSSLYLGLGLLIALTGIPLSPSFVPQAVNGIIQFFLGNLALLLLLYLYARYRQAYDQMNQIAHTDHLTGLPNRRRMTQLIEENLALRQAQPVALLILDLDHFKQINDNYGHSVGDQVLREAGLLLQSRLRRGDVLARWGGEEFLVLAPDSSLETAQALGQRLRETLEATLLPNGVRVTVSLGLTTSHYYDTPDTLLHRADTALYRAKAAGRNRLETELA